MFCLYKNQTFAAILNALYSYAAILITELTYRAMRAH